MTNYKVMHVLEATAGGTRRYLEDMVFSGALDSYKCAFVYSLLGSDQQFHLFLPELAKRNWELYEVAMKRDFKLTSIIKSVLEIRRAILAFQPDIIHCHSSIAGALGRIASLLIRKRNRPLIVYTPNALAIYLGKQYIYVEQILARFTDLFVAISDSEAREIARYCKISPKYINTVWPSINCSHYSPISRKSIRQTLGISLDVKIVTVIGRLSEQKNPLGFLEIYKQLKVSRPDLLAIWVGDGDLRPKVEEIQTQFGLEGLTITGWITDVRPFIAGADVVVVPSRFESFGYVTAESQAMERPVVATRVNGSIDIVKDGITGYFFDVEDISVGVKKIDYLLSNAEKADEMGKNGRILVQTKFSSSEMCCNLEKAYLKIIES